MAPLIVDGIIVLVICVALWRGWRQGALSSVFSAAGAIVGLIVGAAAAPSIMSIADAAWVRFLLAVLAVVVMLALGSLVGDAVGSTLRRAIRMRIVLTLDSAVGSVFRAGVALLVLWIITIPLVMVLPGTLSPVLRESAILREVDRIAPDSLSTLPSRISAMLNDSGLPPLLSPFQALGPEVAAPRIEVSDVDLIRSVQPSVVRIVGDSVSCGKRLSGSGFVVAEGYVVTNAHVVAGTNTVRLETATGTHDADVVYFAPDLDIAVLRAPGMGLAPLHWATYSAATGQDAAILGYPGSGPFTAEPARVRDQPRITSLDIYAENRVQREAYILRSNVREGNSGGPVIDEAGNVLGVVFGTSLDETDTGYALTSGEVRARIGDITRFTTPVSTMQCTAR